MKVTRFLWRYFRRYGHWTALAVVSALVFSAAFAGMVSLIEPIFDEVLLAGPEALPALPGLAGGDSAEDGESGEEGVLAALDLKARLDDAYEGLKDFFGIDSRSVVFFAPLLFVFIFLVRGAAAFVSGYSFQRIGFGITTDIRNDLYDHMLHQSSRFHAQHTSGDLFSRIVNDVQKMQNAVSNRVLDLFQQAAALVALLVLLLSTHFELALVCLVATPAFLFPIVRFGRGMRRTSHRSQERMADLSALLSEGIRGHKVVKAFGMERFEHGRFMEATRRHLKVNLRAQVLSQASSPVVESLAAVGACALLIYAAHLIRSQELTAPVLVEFLANLLLMYDPIRRLNKVNLILQEALAAVHRIADLMAIPNEIVDHPKKPPLSTLSEGVRFEAVSFAYDERQVLKDFTLDLRCGETVALVGPSGAGKSTVVSLLPRFFDPDAGRISIDGVDIRELPLENLRSLIGLVTQDTVLFNDTVRNNIAYGRQDLPVERVREAAAAAYADEFIMELSRGYDTQLGEGGLSLSGGQRQRLAIARALLKNAPILILDEATSHLDTESESLVQKALENLMQGRTALVVAHRLSTVMRAHRIVVMESGKIVEEGSHRELLDLGGSYKKLYDLQFRA